MAKRSRWAARYHEWAMRRGFPILLRIAPRLPRWLLHLGARLVITAVMLAYRGPNREIEANLSRVTGLRPGSRALAKARRAMFYNLAIYWTDLFHLCQLPYERCRKVLSGVHGLEGLEEALAPGRGAMLLTAHLGNWELGGVYLRELEREISVVYVPDASPSAEAFRTTLRDKIGVDAVPIDPTSQLSSLPLLRALREGRVLAMQGDRDFNDRGPRLPFCGEPAPFPDGPFLLAHMTGARLVPSFIVYDDDFGIELHFGQPIAVTGPDRAAAVRRAMEEWVAVLEDAVRRWPTQWYTFYDFWSGASARPGFDAADEARQEAV